MCQALFFFNLYADYPQIQSFTVPVPPNATDDREFTVLSLVSEGCYMLTTDSGNFTIQSVCDLVKSVYDCVGV